MPIQGITFYEAEFFHAKHMPNQKNIVNLDLTPKSAKSYKVTSTQ